MGGYGVQVTLVLVLVALNAVFAGSEMALVTLRDSQLQRLESESTGGQVLARLARDPNRFLATIQIGITLAGFLASAAAAVSLAEPLVGPLAALGSAAEPVAIVVVTVALAFLTLVLGELAPKRIAMQRAEGWALVVARPIDLLSRLSRPVVWLLSAATDLVVRLTGADPRASRDEVSVEEIRDLLTARREFSAEQQTIISGAFEFTERTLREILVPRPNVVAIPSGAPVAEAVQIMIDAGHSRAPVKGRQGLDTVVGIAHLRDLFGAQGAVDDHVHPPELLPETMRVSDALRLLRQRRQHFAMVVDEHGAIDGIVTMEDLVEEIIGEIYDETDRDVQAVVHSPDGSMVLPGSFPVHDLPGIGVELPRSADRDYTTVAGLVLAQLGHIPTAAGEEVSVAGYRLEVLEVVGRAISSVRLSAVQPESPEPSKSPDPSESVTSAKDEVSRP